MLVGLGKALEVSLDFLMSAQIHPGHGFVAFEKPRRLKRLVSRAVGEELISPVRAAALLDQSLESVERQIRGPAIQ